jgi:hypothetical protein
MDVVDALAACGGAARRPDLARLGVDDAALRRASRAGIATQPARGLYALPSADPAHVALLLRRQLLTCISAAPLHGLWVLDCSRPAHVYHRRGEVFDGDVPHGGLFLPRTPTGQWHPSVTC